jgi:hypothetical protein
MNKIKDVILDSLDKYKGAQINLDSEAAREALAKDIFEDLQKAAKNDTEMYLEFYL